MTDEPNAPAPPAGAPHAPAKGRGNKPMLVLVAVSALSVGAYLWHRVASAGEADTDDAQIEADVVPLAARTGGLVLRVRVLDNHPVHRGEVLAELDPAEHTARVAQAEAELANARAQLQVAEADVQLTTATATGGLRTARAVVSSAVEASRSARAQIVAAEAGVTRAQAQQAQTRTTLQRARTLFASGAASRAELDNAQSADDAAQAAVAQAQAQAQTARASQLSVMAQVTQAEGRLEQSTPVEASLASARARVAVAQAKVQSSQAALDLARLQLSYTQVTAPADGVVSRLSVHEGQLLTAGQPIAELVPNETYLVANFKETQVGRMVPGQRVEVHIDAYPGRALEGQVESLSGGTGARFSLLPPDNASGNFVKVVQRIPVRIRWTRVPSDLALRAGLSADATVFFH